MIEPVLTALQALSNAKSLFDLVLAVSRYIKRKSTDADPSEMRLAASSQAERQRALEATFNEWGHIAVMVEPDIEQEIEQYASASLRERAEVLAELAKKYAAVDTSSPHTGLDHILLRHTSVVATPEGKLQMRLGQSEQTRYLQGEVIDIPGDSTTFVSHQMRESGELNGGKMQLPVFKVTMLGDSGVGKTVFMSSMYAKLREGHGGIAIRAISDDIDLELDQNMRALYAQKKWPPGTDVNEKNYEFELLLRKNPIAQIDWVDYRGGALLESTTKEGGITLIKRLQESHSIIWMVDMSQLVGCSINSTPARLMTGVGRMAQLCRQAIRGKNNLQSILFIRTKADEVLDDKGSPDMGKACEQLIEHLGPDNFSDIPCSAAVAVSSVGRVSSDKRPVGDNPYNVEWPLILSLAILLEMRLRNLDKAADSAYQDVAKKRPGKVVGFFKELLELPPNAGELKAMQNLDNLSQQVLGMSEVIGELVKNCPRSIRMF
jgi:hypothetical protein